MNPPTKLATKASNPFIIKKINAIKNKAKHCINAIFLTSLLVELTNNNTTKPPTFIFKILTIITVFYIGRNGLFCFAESKMKPLT